MISRGGVGEGQERGMHPVFCGACALDSSDDRSVEISDRLNDLQIE